MVHYASMQIVSTDLSDAGADSGSVSVEAPLPTPAYAASLNLLSTPRELTDFFLAERQALQERWSSRYGGRHWMHDYASLLDAMLRRLFTLSLERVGKADPTGLCVIATGGYGQRLLAPASDLDVTFVAARDEDSPVLKAMFDLLTGIFMSGARMKVGYAYRTLADIESGTLDHQTQTALLDARAIAGDMALFNRFERLFEENLHTADFLFRKVAEQAERRRRVSASVYEVEPDIKNGMGGLRDLQTAAWMGNVRFHRAGEALWRDLVRRRVITRDDFRRLSEGREFLLTVRCALNFATGSQRDLLTRPRQEEVAARLGMTDANGLSDVQGFMGRYYATAGDIARISDKVVARCLDTPIALDADGKQTGLSCVRRRVVVTEPEQAEADSLWPIRALEFCQTYDLELALATDEAIQRFVENTPWHEPDEMRAAGRAFQNLLVKPGDVYKTLRRMRRTHLLKTLLPELDACMGLVPYDPSHVHTVGEHSLHVLENLLSLRDPLPALEDQEDERREHYRAALLNLDNPLPLHLAALLHDIGKQWQTTRTGENAPHEITGAEAIPDILTRLGATPLVIAQTEFLVRYHLVLAQTSRLRDLTQTATIREVARTVDDLERLRMLYLLTWADTKAVGPGVLTEMNARLLTELFERTESFLSREDDVVTAPDLETERRATDAQLSVVRERLQKRLSSDRVNTEGVSTEAVAEHVNRMPAAYLLNTPPETMARHLAMVARLEAGETVVINMRTLAPEIGLTEITVVTPDDPQPGLLSKLTGALLACDVLLHTAQVFTRTEPDGTRIAIDTITCNYRDRALGPDRRNAVEAAIREVLDGTHTIADLLQRRRKPFDAHQTVRDFNVEDVGPEYTLVDVEAPDTLGVVYRLSALISGWGWNIHAARATTWGGNARSAFYVTDKAGEPLDVESANTQLQAAFAEPTA